MIALDDRTGNVLTTIALFAAVAAVAYAARAMLVVFVLSLLFAYLLEPSVVGVQRLFKRRSISRANVIALVYAGAAVLFGAAAYAIEPVAVDQLRAGRRSKPATMTGTAEGQARSAPVGRATSAQRTPAPGQNSRIL